MERRARNYRKVNTFPDPRGTGTRGKALPPRRERQAGERGRPSFLQGRLSSAPVRGGTPNCDRRSLEARADPSEGSRPRALGPRGPQGAVRFTSRSSAWFRQRMWGKVPSGFWQGDRKQPVLNSPEHSALDKACPQGNLVSQSLTDRGPGTPSSGPPCHPGHLRGKRQRNPCGSTYSGQGSPVTRPQNTSLHTSPPPP